MTPPRTHSLSRSGRPAPIALNSAGPKGSTCTLKSELMPSAFLPSRMPLLLKSRPPSRPSALGQAHPAAMDYVRIPSQGALLNGVLYTASGAGPHPACAVAWLSRQMNRISIWRRRCAGPASLCYAALSRRLAAPVDFSFTHAAQDADAAVSFMTGNAAKYAVDSARIFRDRPQHGRWLAPAPPIMRPISPAW